MIVHFVHSNVFFVQVSRPVQSRTTRVQPTMEGLSLDTIASNQPTTSSISKARQQGKPKIKRSKNYAKSSKRNITLIVLFTCFLYIFGTAPYVLAYMSTFIYERSFLLANFTMFSLGMLFLAHGVNFFVYVSVNRLFRRVLYDYITCKWFSIKKR